MNKNLKIILLVLILLGSIYLFLKYLRPGGIEPWMIKDWVLNVGYYPVAKLIKETLLTPIFLIAIGLTLLMERLIPANPQQKIFGIHFYQDMAWFFYETVLDAIILTTYVYWLTQLYKTYFGFLTIEAAVAWPVWVRFIISVLLLDFLYWFQHYLNHKVPWFWQFHVVHHSQEEINFFTDYRYHIFEYIVRQTILVIPFLILKINTPTIVLFSIFRRWYTRFYHGNIRTNMGPLKYVLVTPQSHRVHHSYLMEHRDLNFGSLFSIWDFIFGTQYKGFSEYPPTGVPDAEDFPHGKEVGFPGVIFMPLVQLVYPFQVLGKQIKTKLFPKK